MAGKKGSRKKVAADAPAGSVEEAKQRYCAKFQHKGCGGTPLAWVGSGSTLGCSGCDLRIDVAPNEPLGDQLAREPWEQRA